MAYGLKYHNTFSTEDSKVGRLEILELDYTGLSKNITLSGEPVVIRRGAQNVNKFTPIVGASCTISILSTETLQWAEFFTSSDVQFKVDFYLNESLYFSGFVQTDIYQEPYLKTPFVIQITATDGLANLKDKTFELITNNVINAGVDPQDINANYISKEVETEFQVTLNALIWYIQSQMTQYSGELYESIEYIPDASAAATVDLTKWVINQSAFEGKTYYQVLEYLMQVFLARVYQKKGKLWIDTIAPNVDTVNYLEDSPAAYQYTGQTVIAKDRNVYFGRGLEWYSNDQVLEITPAFRKVILKSDRSLVTRTVFEDPLDLASVSYIGIFTPGTPPGDPNTEVTPATFYKWTYPTTENFLSIYNTPDDVLFSFSYYWTGGWAQTYPNGYLFTTKRWGYRSYNGNLSFTFTIEINLSFVDLIDATDLRVTFQCYGLDDNDNPTATVQSFDGTDMQATVQYITFDKDDAKLKFARVTFTTPIFQNTSGDNGVVVCFGFHQLGTTDINSKFNEGLYRNAKIELANGLPIPTTSEDELTNTGFNVDYTKTVWLSCGSGDYDGEIFINPHCLAYKDASNVYREVLVVLDPFSDDTQNLEYWNLLLTNNQYKKPSIKLNGTCRGDIDIDSIVTEPNFPNRKFMVNFIEENVKSGTKAIEIIEIFEN